MSRLLLLAVFFITVLPSEADANGNYVSTLDKTKGHVASVASLKRAQGKANHHAKTTCKNAETYYMRMMKCEGWHYGICVRASLVKPNEIDCFPYFFMSTRASRRHMDCNRRVRYTGVSVRMSQRKSSKWNCAMYPGKHHHQAHG